MFDKTLPFYYFDRFLRMTMPPIELTMTSRWNTPVDDDEDPSGDAAASNFFLVDDVYDEESARGFDLPSDIVDPEVDTETGASLLQWIDRQAKWGGFGTIQDCLDGSLAKEHFTGTDFDRLEELFV